MPNEERYDYPHLPPELREGLRRYADERLQPGGLLTAVLENDLARAAAVLHRSLTADGLRDVVLYVQNELPAPSHGSAAHVVRWLAGNPGAPEFGSMGALLAGEFDRIPTLERYLPVLKRLAGDEPLTPAETKYVGGLLLGTLARIAALEAPV